MTEVTFRDDVTVELRDCMGDEDTITRVARVSTLGADSRDADANTGLLKYLYREKHGVPFESCILQFYFEIPIFVSRQIVKHRLSSINEESGRYRELLPNFYLVPPEREIVQIGKTGEYKFEPGRPDQYEALKFVQTRTAQAAWDNYEALRLMGIAKEVARMYMPLGMYSSMYMTANLRSWLNFISLRKNWLQHSIDNETFEPVHISKPQYEIELVTDKVAAHIEEKFPNVWKGFVDSRYAAV